SKAIRAIPRSCQRSWEAQRRGKLLQVRRGEKTRPRHQSNDAADSHDVDEVEEKGSACAAGEPLPPTTTPSTPPSTRMSPPSRRHRRCQAAAVAEREATVHASLAEHHDRELNREPGTAAPRHSLASPRRHLEHFLEPHGFPEDPSFFDYVDYAEEEETKDNTLGVHAHPILLSY
ncbi:unnamed protein product, partial [Urochloa humidicola]